MNAPFHTPNPNCVFMLWEVTVLFAVKDRIKSGTGGLSH